MNKKDIIKLIEGTSKDKEKIIAELLRNAKKRKLYELLKAEHTAASLKKFNDDSGIVPQKKNAFGITLLKYASLFIILLASSFFMWTYKEGLVKIEADDHPIVLVTTGIGEKKEVFLSDSTKVTLNANSILTYPRNFDAGSRNVTLKGEAYFDVTRDESRPFTVSTDKGMKVKVLGTSFNVKSYPEDESIQTTLVSGKVRVVEERDNKIVVLNPSQKATYVKNEEKMIVEKVDPSLVTSWKEGKLIYRETPLKNVIKDLERSYKVKFRVKSEELLNYKYNGEFDNLTLDQVLNLFELSSPIKYTYVNDQVILDIEK